MKVQCPHCSSMMNDQHLPTHLRDKHHLLPSVSSDSGDTSSSPTPKRRRVFSSDPDHTAQHVVNLKGSYIFCPVPECPVYSAEDFVIRRHLCIRHPMVQFRFIGGSDIHDQCPCCGICLSHLTPKHFQSKFCVAQSARRARIDSNERCLASADESIPFHIGDSINENVPSIDSFSQTTMA